MTCPPPLIISITIMDCCRKKPAPDPLASLEEAAARVLGPTLSAATPRAATAAAGLLDLAPSGRRGGPFARRDPDTPSVGSAGGGSGEGAFLDTASGDEFEVWPLSFIMFISVLSFLAICSPSIIKVIFLVLMSCTRRNRGTTWYLLEAASCRYETRGTHRRGRLICKMT
jgi:hypothetical protein